jgi:hypothetical protein
VIFARHGLATAELMVGRRETIQDQSAEALRPNTRCTDTLKVTDMAARRA